MEEQKYDKITIERKKALITLCIAGIVQQLSSKTQEQLKQNQANILLKSSYDCLKRGDLEAQRQEELFINSVCEELYAKKAEIKQTTKFEQEKIAAELFIKYGIEQKGTDYLASQLEGTQKNALGREQNIIQGTLQDGMQGTTQDRTQESIEESQNSTISQTKESEIAELNFFTMYHPEVLKPNKNQKQPAIQYLFVPYAKTQNHIFQLEDEKITIRKTGELNYNTLNGESYLHEYLITKQDKEGSTTEVEKVFTDILVSRMESDLEYRNIVLTQLLSNRNLHLQNSYGYIGKIDVNWNDKQKKPEYKLEYFQEEYTAVVELQRMKREKRKKEEQVK